MSGYQTTVLKTSLNTTIPEAWITDPATESWCVIACFPDVGFLKLSNNVGRGRKIYIKTTSGKDSTSLLFTSNLSTNHCGVSYEPIAIQCAVALGNGQLLTEGARAAATRVGVQSHQQLKIGIFGGLFP